MRKGRSRRKSRARLAAEAKKQALLSEARAENVEARASLRPPYSGGPPSSDRDIAETKGVDSAARSVARLTRIESDVEDGDEPAPITQPSPDVGPDGAHSGSADSADSSPDAGGAERDQELADSDSEPAFVLKEMDPDERSIPPIGDF